MLVIKEIGFCTTLIDNVDELTDAFIDEDLYKKNKIDLHKDTLNIALKEAKAENIPIIAVGMPIADYPKAATITEAFNMAFKEKRVAVVCMQLDSNKKRETAVFNLENSDNQNGWAAIENIEYITIKKNEICFSELLKYFLIYRLQNIKYFNSEEITAKDMLMSRQIFENFDQAISFCENEQQNKKDKYEENGSGLIISKEVIKLEEQNAENKYKFYEFVKNNFNTALEEIFDL